MRHGLGLSTVHSCLSVWPDILAALCRAVPYIWDFLLTLRAPAFPACWLRAALKWCAFRAPSFQRRRQARLCQFEGGPRRKLSTKTNHASRMRPKPMFTMHVRGSPADTRSPDAS